MLVAMKRMTLAGLRQEETSLLHALQRVGAVEIISVNDAPEDDEKLTELESKAARLSSSIKFLGKHAKKKKSMLAVRPMLPLQELVKTEDAGAFEAAQRMEQQLAANHAEKTALRGVVEQMAPWSALDVPIEKIRPTRSTALIAGFVPSKQEPLLLQNEMVVDGRVFVELLGEMTGSRAVFVCCLDSDLDAFYESVRDIAWVDASFPKMDGRPAEITRQCEARIQALEDEAKALEEAIAGLSGQGQTLQRVYDATRIECDRLTAEQAYMRTQRAFVIDGWVRCDETEKVAKAVAEVTDAYSLEFRDALEDEIPPSVVQNIGIVSPFEMVTNLYSRPDPNSKRDPSPWMAPFFFIFFGMMVSDAGYGIILGIGATLFSLKMRPRGMMKKLGWLLALGGVSTLVWGALFGGWVGVSLTPLWFSPTDEPIMMLAVCYALGFLHIFTGMGLKMAADFKRGDWVAAICDTGFWYLLIVGLVLLAAPMLGLPAIIGEIGKYMAIGGALGLLLTQGRAKKGIFKKLTGGLLSLYNITGVLGDVLSYSRLFALGLATGVIGLVFNTIAAMVGTNILGYVFMVVILVVGHVFNIVINTLGAYVHASRLQYIEFFGKFYESGGRAFNPLCIRTKYVDVNEI